MGWTPMRLRDENRRPKPRRLLGKRVVIYRRVRSQNMLSTIKYEKPKSGRLLALKRKDRRK